MQDDFSHIFLKKMSCEIYTTRDNEEFRSSSMVRGMLFHALNGIIGIPP